MKTSTTLISAYNDTFCFSCIPNDVQMIYVWTMHILQEIYPSIHTVFSIKVVEDEPFVRHDKSRNVNNSFDIGEKRQKPRLFMMEV